MEEEISSVPFAGIEAAVKGYQEQFDAAKASFHALESEYEQRKTQLVGVIHQLNGAIVALNLLLQPAPPEASPDADTQPQTE